MHWYHAHESISTQTYCFGIHAIETNVCYGTTCTNLIFNREKEGQDTEKHRERD